MLDLLLDLLGGLLGLDVKGEQPAKRSRPGAPATKAPPPNRQKMSMDDLVKQIVGREQLKKQQQQAAAQQQQQPAPRRQPPPREEREHRVRPPQKAAAPVFTPAPEPVREPMREPMREPARAATPRTPDFVSALRGNPDAARQAFVYSEIFGKPLADR